MKKANAARIFLLWAASFGSLPDWVGTSVLALQTGEQGQPVKNVPKPNLAQLSLEELSSIKVKTVYGASKHEQKTTEAPSSVTIITRDDIQKMGHRTLADILNSVRSFYVTYDRGYAFIGARGVNRPGDFGGRMLLLLNGHRLNDGIYSTSASDTDFPLDVDLIDRVEIIRGPGSSLYGDNAFFGVINVITRVGHDYQGVEMSGSYGSLDTWDGRAGYGKRFANGVEVLVSGTLYGSAGQARLSFPEFVSEGLDGSWSRQAFTNLSYKGFSFQSGYSRRQKDWPTAAYDTIPNSHDPSMSTIDERAWADLRFEHKFPGAWGLKTRAYLDRYRFDGYYPYDYDHDPKTPVIVNRDMAIANWAGLDWSLDKALSANHQLTLGGEWRHDFDLLQRNWDMNPRTDYLNSNVSGNILGFFVQDEWTIRKGLIVNVGLRLDHYSTFGNTANPRMALIYEPGEATTFKYIYGRAFRAPNAYELHYSSTNSTDNPNLQPEAIRSQEIVWEQRFGPHWRTQVAAFWNNIQDLINQEIDPSNNLFVFKNSGAALARGVEMEVETKLKWGLRSLASYTLTQTQDRKTGRIMNNSPRHMGKVNLSVPLWREKIFAGLEFQAMSNRLTVGGGQASAYSIANLTLFNRNLFKGLELSASIRNLFNQRYAHPVSADFAYTGPISGNPILLDTVEQDGRTLRVKLNYRF